MIPTPSKWNKFSAVIKELKKYTNGTTICVPDVELEKLYNKHKIEKRSFSDYMASLERRRIVTEYIADETSETKIVFKNKRVLEVIKDAGCVLELETYYTRLESSEYDDVRVGTCIDWDGIIHKSGDVENEIDVITIKDNIINFVSCKNYEIDKPELYEIDSVASHFGDKYVKKEIVTTGTVQEVCAERAKEMDITITLIVDKNNSN